MSYLGKSARLLLLASTACMAWPSYAQTVEKIVVTGNRIGQVPEDRLGTAVSTISALQIEQRQTLYVSDILRDVPGLAISRTGGAGGATQVRTRGSEGNHTLVLLDGAEINDPFQGEFDFAGLLGNDIERIEILRGSQSALYGSDAIGGVINIIPKRGRGDLSFAGQAEAGSFASTSATASASFGTDVFDIYASTAFHSTDGSNISRAGNEEDGSLERTYFVNAGLRFTPDIELRAFIRKVGTRAEGDPQDFDFLSPTQGLAVDGDDVTRTDAVYGNVQLEATGFGGVLETRLSYNFTDGSRFNYSFGAPAFFSEGHRDKVSGVVAASFSTGDVHHRLTGAIDWKQESYQNLPIGAPTPVNDIRRLQNIGTVASYDVEYGDLNAGIALRHDQNERFEDATTYRVQVSYRFADTRLRATAGSGIKNPNNFELFGFDPASFIGNPDLKAERSVGWDIGIDQYLLDRKVKLTATWFNATLEDEIYTDFILPAFIATPKNRTEDSQRQGLELTADASLGDWTLSAAYTWTDAEEDGLEEIRRPRHTGSLTVGYAISERGQLGIGLRFNGEQQDNEFIFATPEDYVTLQSFTLVNVYGSWKLTDNLEAFGRVENLLDEQYEEVFSFTSPGVSAYAGLRFRM